MNSEAIFLFFPAMFDALQVFLTCPPVLYVFSIFFLAFSLLLFRKFRE